MRAIAFLLLLLPCLIPEARAQVSVDLRALDPAGPARAPAEPSRPAVPRVTVPRPRVESIRPPVTPHAPKKPVVAAVPPLPVPSAAVQGHGPPTVSQPPLAALPTEQPAPPPASTIIPPPAPAPGPMPPPVRLVFETGKTDLTPGDEAAIRDLARSMPTPAADSVDVTAYAAGKADDPSTARRLSLSRGLAVRSVLLASGVPSARIYVRALGSTAHDGPADRVELTVTPVGTVAR